MGGLLALLCAACGSERSPVGPTPTPGPGSFTGSVTDTITGAPVSGFSALIAGGRLTVSAPGYVTRETRANASSVDLIPEAGFDLDFYRQFARGAVDGPIEALRVLSRPPSIYLQTAGLSASNVAALEQAARAVVPAMTGGRFQVQAWETGDSARAESAGWVVVDVVNDDSPCGRAATGATAGHVWLNITARCRFGGFVAYPGILAHELGHSLGFRHVDRPGHMMRSGYEADRKSVV